MRRYYVLTALVVIAAFALASAQAHKGPRAAGRKAATGLPSKATVQSFLKHVFGYEPNVSWTITSIQPSPAPGIAEVTVNFQSGTNAGQKKLYVLPGHRHAIGGEMVPFAGGFGSDRPSDAAINNFVREMSGGANPNITWTILEVKPRAVDNLTEVTVVLNTPQGRGAAYFYVTPDQKHALRGEVVPFGADPYAADRAKLEKGINGAVRGPAHASMTIVEFADLQCPACKSANPEIQRLVGDEPKARFVFQQFPLTQIHKWAFKAAEFGDCIYRENPAAFWKFLEDVYSAQEQITQATGNTEDAGRKAVPRLTQLASQAGVNGEKTAACAEQPATTERINRSLELGKEMKISGTPTLFVGGRKISNLSQMPYETLKRMVDWMEKK